VSWVVFELGLKFLYVIYNKKRTCWSYIFFHKQTTLEVCMLASGVCIALFLACTIGSWVATLAIVFTYTLENAAKNQAYWQKTMFGEWMHNGWDIRHKVLDVESGTASWLIHFAMNFYWLVNGLHICFVVSIVFGLEMLSFDDILWKPMARRRG